MNRILRIALIPAIVAMLALAGVGAAYAATPSSGVTVKGTVSTINQAVTPPTVTITPEEGQPVTVNIVSGTVITKTGVGTINLGDVAVGNTVIATYDKSTNDTSKITVGVPVPEHEPIIGTIQSIGSLSLVIATKNNGNVTVNVNAQTKYDVPGVANATVANFKVGDRVAVLTTESNGSYLAIHVNLVPGKALGMEEHEQGQPGESDNMVKGHNGEHPAPGAAMENEPAEMEAGN